MKLPQTLQSAAELKFSLLQVRGAFGKIRPDFYYERKEPEGVERLRRG